MAVCAYTEATVYLQHDRFQDHIIASEAPSPSTSKLHNLERRHALLAQCIFLSSTTGCGFILARVVNNGSVLELRYCALSTNPTSNDSMQVDMPRPYSGLNSTQGDLPAVNFHFAETFVGLGLLEDEQHSAIYVILLSSTGTLIRLTFRAPDLFYAETLPEEYCVEYPVASLHSKQPHTLHLLDTDSVLIACTDGTLVKLKQARADTSTGQLHERTFILLALIFHIQL